MSTWSKNFNKYNKYKMNATFEVPHEAEYIPSPLSRRVLSTVLRLFEVPPYEGLYSR
jgi:hypothetical protein